MVMNKSGQAAVIGVMVSIMIFITAVVLIEPIKEVVIEARSADYLNCTSSALTTGTQATCIMVDLFLPYFFVVVVAAGLGYITFRFLSGTPRY